jgi:hypothetical protein
VKASSLDIYQGDDYRAVVNLTHNGGAADLTGFTAPSAQLRRDVADVDTGTPDAAFTCAIVGSTVTLYLAHATTAALSGCYVWDLQLTGPLGDIITVARGPAHVTQEVTR